MNDVTSIPDSSLVETVTARKCPEGHDLSADASMDLCPACLYAVALEAPRDSKRFGEYELLERIGRGGMGVVYKARHVRAQQHTVALKMILNGELASEAEVRRFQLEVEAASALGHENIVPIYNIGEEDGRHYFTMQLMHGGSLADHIDRYREDLRQSAKLVSTIAMAMHHAHQRGILHRDLTPANILLDSEGKPHVADFGVAKRIGKNGPLTHTGSVVGKPQYMAPEQADPRGKDLTIAVDVYSLGVILYELVTGRCPFEGEDAGEILEKVLHVPSPDPRTFEPRIDLDLAAICLRCLEKDPANRYPSAEELARELQRYLNDEPIAKVSRVKRVWRWCKRRPLMAALIVECVLLLVVATLAVFSGAAAQEKDRREEVLRANEYAARWVAGTVLYKLNSYHDLVANAARDFPPELFASLRNKEVRLDDEMDLYCRDIFDRYRLPDGRTLFDTVFMRDAEGRSRARWPLPPARLDYIRREYGWADFFKGARKLAEARSRSAYISRASVSQTTKKLGIVIAAPIYNENGEPIGVLGTTIETGATLGTLELKDPSDNRHIAMIVGPRDNDHKTPDKPLPEDHVILIHDSLGPGMTATLKSNAAVHAAVALAEKSNPNRGLEQLLLPEPNAVVSDEAFCDPVMDGPCEDEFGKTRTGRWLAGFAPIGNTGFVAIVETPRETAAHPNQTLARRLMLWGVLPFMLGTALVAGILAVARRKK